MLSAEFAPMTLKMTYTRAAGCIAANNVELSCCYLAVDEDDVSVVSVNTTSFSVDESDHSVCQFRIVHR